MSPYTSLWTGVSEGDGPRVFHLVLLDAGRTRVLADRVGRDALRCIRCSACINVCPVYRQTGGHAYHTPYAGPIGAILAPQLEGEHGSAGSLPFASSLCGACYDVCPVKIDIPSILVHERAKTVRRERAGVEGLALRRLAGAFASRARYERAQRLARRLQRPVVRDGWLTRFPPGPLAAWGRSRDLPAVPDQTFREWWESRDRS
jgi:L-lactate dehydrogenase complex protein LldF